MPVADGLDPAQYQAISPEFGKGRRETARPCRAAEIAQIGSRSGQDENEHNGDEENSL
ncbi:MAG: hypothetical protein GVY32_05895 [Gammaproteobacteria bacterium]|nr:hypothetical protein [Gammaproteobacteria bacterium]